MSKINAIIFDLGGVIINLDTPATIAAFNRLSEKPFETIYTQLQQTPLFDLFDKGLIGETEFFNGLRVAMDVALSDEQLREAWNAMLLDFPAHRLELLLQLRQKYRLFLLSNTNETHVSRFEADLLATRGYANLQPFFENVYYSCRMGMRKPDVEIFGQVLRENGLRAAETLFIDDTPHHVNGAKQAGIDAHLLPAGTEFKTLLQALNLL